MVVLPHAEGTVVFVGRGSANETSKSRVNFDPGIEGASSSEEKRNGDWLLVTRRRRSPKQTNNVTARGKVLIENSKSNPNEFAPLFVDRQDVVGPKDSDSHAEQRVLMVNL